MALQISQAGDRFCLAAKQPPGIWRWSLPKLMRILAIFFLLFNLASCAPAAAPAVQPLTENPTLDSPSTPLALISLVDPNIDLELDTLIEYQKSREVSYNAVIWKWHLNPAVVWNEQARYWVAYYGLDPVVATRVYALTSVAQQRALDSVDRKVFSSRAPSELNAEITPVEIRNDPYDSAILLGAAQVIFLHLFPEAEKELIKFFDESRQSLLVSGNILPSDLAVAEEFGREVAEKLF